MTVNKVAGDKTDENTRDNEREDLPGPTEDRDTGASGSTDTRSSENRREGLEKDEGRD